MLSGYKTKRGFPDEVTDYFLARDFGFTEDEILGSRGHWIDWLVECRSVEQEIEQERTDAANRERNRGR